MASASLALWREQHPSLGYVAPFVSVLAFIALPKPAIFQAWEWPAQVLVVAAICCVTWPAEVSRRPAHWLIGAALGAAVFLLWIAPELIHPNYRHSSVFSNSIFGQVGSSMRPEALRSGWVLFWRTVRASTVVPVAEELFWRGWLMRWIGAPDFRRIPLGAYIPLAFWCSALLFGLEHGPYWDVGLLTGIVYNAWMVRTKSLADCILVHSVTNFILSLYVIAYGQWQYWQ